MRGDYGKMMADGNPDPKVATPCFLAAVLAHHFPSTPAPSEEEKKSSQCGRGPSTQRTRIHTFRAARGSQTKRACIPVRNES